MPIDPTGHRRDHFDLLLEDLARRRQHFRRKLRAGHHCLAASTTSSIVPFRKNARSGSSSWLPA